jgi:hypothetical protein
LKILANLPSFFEHLTYALLVISCRFHILFVRIAAIHVAKMRLLRASRSAVYRNDPTLSLFPIRPPLRLSLLVRVDSFDAFVCPMPQKTGMGHFETAT